MDDIQQTFGLIIPAFQFLCIWILAVIFFLVWTFWQDITDVLFEIAGFSINLAFHIFLFALNPWLYVLKILVWHVWYYA